MGLGNIAGVAIAIGTGGPGACFWIILIGLLGMSAKFAECTLGQLYRTKDESGNVLGGPMRYLKVGLADVKKAALGKFLAVLFMLLCVMRALAVAMLFHWPALEAIRGDIPILQEYPVLYGVVMAVCWICHCWRHGSIGLQVKSYPSCVEHTFCPHYLFC